MQRVEKVASVYNIPPDELIWKYTHRQITELYRLILRREVKEKNELVKIIQAGRSKLEGDFITFKADDEKTKKTPEGKMIDMGLGSDRAIKNYNPNLKIKDE